MSDIRTYVLVFEDGFWEQGNVERRRKAVRAFTAADAAERWKVMPKSLEWRNGGLIERQRLVDIEPYDHELPEHQDLEVT